MINPTCHNSSDCFPRTLLTYIPTHHRVSALRSHCTCVAASNKHCVALSTSGQVYTWGANHHGQLGYGTSGSGEAGASGGSPTPRMVEALKVRANWGRMGAVGIRRERQSIRDLFFQLSPEIFTSDTIDCADSTRSI